MNNGNPFNQGGSASGQPAQYGMPMPSMSNQPKKSHKGLIIGISSAVAAVVVAVVGVVLFLVLTGVSKKDYQDAQAQTKKVGDLIDDDSDYMKALNDNPLTSSSLSSSSLLSSSSYSNSSASESDIDKYAKNISSLQSELKTNINKLSEMKAVKNDKDAKDKFDKLQKSYGTFSKDLTLLHEMYSDDGLKPTIMAAQDAMSSASSVGSLSSVEDYQALYSKMATSFRKVGEVASKAKLSDQTLTEKTQALGKEYNKMADLFDKMAKIMQTRDASAAQSIESEMTSLSSEVQTVVSDFQDALTSRADTIDKNGNAVVDAVNSLGEYLSSKANK